MDSGYIKVVNLDGTTLDILKISTQAPNLLLVYKVILTITYLTTCNPITTVRYFVVVGGMWDE